MHAAVLAEHVLRNAGIETVDCQFILAADELELITCNDQMQKALLGADRAIAVRDPIKISGHAKTHPATMTSALVGPRHLLVLLLLPEQPELRRIARGLGEAEVAEGMRRQQPAARRALDEALLDHERLDDLLDRVARLRQRRSDGLDPDRAAAVVLRDHRDVAPVHGVKAGGIDLERLQRL